MTTLRTTFLCLFFAVACAKTTTPDQGTNTNWLKVCDEESDCDADDACLCGVCTKPCSEDDQCGAVNVATSCEPLEEAACGASTEARACLQGCDESADCSALENGRCVLGLCVAEREETPAPSYELTAEGGAVVLTDAYTACTRHQECEIVGTGCFPTCCEGGAIRDELYAMYEANFMSACQGANSADCSTECSMPAQQVAGCLEGHCALFDSMANCFSPQNPEFLNAAGASGCECTVLDQLVCFGRDAGMLCEAVSPSGQYWHDALDDTCTHPDFDLRCTNGEERATIEACTADFMICYELPGGAFCGLNP